MDGMMYTTNIRWISLICITVEYCFCSQGGKWTSSRGCWKKWPALECCTRSPSCFSQPRRTTAPGWWHWPQREQSCNARSEITSLHFAHCRLKKHRWKNGYICAQRWTDQMLWMKDIQLSKFTKLTIHSDGKLNVILQQWRQAINRTKQVTLWKKEGK